MQIEIELSGHKGKIRHVWGRVARPPYSLKDVLDIFVDFDEEIEGILGMTIVIPAKEYDPAELKAIIKKEGERQFSQLIENQLKEKAESQLRQQKGEAVKTLAEKAERALQ